MVLTLMLAAGTFIACSNDSNVSNKDDDPPKVTVVAKYGSEKEGAVMTFYSDESFTLEEDSDTKSARALTVTVRGTYEGDPKKPGDTVICTFEDGETKITVTVKDNGSIEFTMDGNTYELTEDKSTPSTPTPPAQSSYKVTFKYKTLTGDETTEEKEVKAGETVDAPVVTPVGQLDNWYVVWVDGDKKVFNLNTPITKNITLTAKEEDSVYLKVKNGSEVYGCNPTKFPADGKIVIPEGITKVLNESFHLDTSVTGVTIADTVTEIGTKAFYKCTSLTSMEIPGSVKSIGEGAFSGCTSLASITLKDGVTSIGKTAFEGCTALTALTIPDSVTTIGTGAFTGCTSLEEVVIGDGVTEIAANMFKGSESLRTVSLGAGVQKIRDYAFAECTNLDSVTIGTGVNSIGERAFFGCTSLTKVEFLGGIEEIKTYAFYGCGPASVKINGDVGTIGDYAFHQSEITSVEIVGNVESIEGKMAFSFSTLKSVKITGNVGTIGNQAFYTTRELESVEIGGDVDTIGEKAFVSSGLAEMKISGKVDKVVDAPFSGSGLTTFIAEGGVREAGSDAFTGSSNLESTEFISTIEIIGARAFASSGISGEVTLNEKVTEIPDGAFSFSKITSINIGDNVESIGGSAFESCEALTNITFGEKVATIGKSAFKNCKALESIEIPDSITIIEEEMFYGAGLKSVNIPANIEEIGKQAFFLSSLKGDLVIPGNVKTIGDKAFSGERYNELRGCAITSVTIEEGVETIGVYAFQGCASLKKVYLPTSLTSFNKDTFNSCSNMTDIYYKGSEEECTEKLGKDLWSFLFYEHRNLKYHYDGWED